jgi:transposase
MDATPLCPSPIELALGVVRFSNAELLVTAIARRRVVACPVCGMASRRVHSRYHRTIGDLPWHGLRVRLELAVRRFFCDTPDCRRRIFTERLPATVASYAQRTTRAAAILDAIGFAVGGRPGARLAGALGLTAGPATILARVRTAVEPAAPTPRVLGVDDWALRRGQRYGTILIDLERHAVVDLLPDRESETFAAWLRSHPGVEIISRDRGGAYADGARQGAPDAIQVADRFHLLRNLMEAVERSCGRQHAALRAAAATSHPVPLPRDTVRQRRYSGLPNNRLGPTVSEQRSAERRARRLVRYEQVVALRATGMAKQRIAGTLGLDRQTVDAWLAAGQFPERATRARRAHPLDAHAAYLRQQLDAGEQNAAHLARELRRRGVRTSNIAVRRYVALLRRLRPITASQAAVPSRLTGPTPSPRETAWLLRKVEQAPTTLTSAEHAYVTTLCVSCPALAAVRSLAGAFHRLVAQHDANALTPWLAAAERTNPRRFVAGIRRDHDAVLAAILFQWSNGQVEGHVNRLKLIKRTMYGRASFALLRRRVLAA